MRVVLTRDVDESEHLVDVVVANIDGAVDAWGAPLSPVIPRSAIKFVQAVPLVRSGAADAYDVGSIELALAAASHSGEREQVEAVEAWLRRIGLTVDALECGVDRPLGSQAADDLLASGEKPGQVHNCCSGKHAGLLTMARHLGVDPAGYVERAHPVQRLVTEAIEHFTGIELSERSNGIDGCGIPTFALPLESLARAMARFGDPQMSAGSLAQATDTPGRTSTSEAVMRLHAALSPNPWWVSGTDRTEVTLSAASSESVLLKTGAEGVFMGVLPQRGLGLALKARDGAVRAANATVAALLEHLDIVPSGTSRSTLRNRAGDEVGEMFVELP